MATKRKVEDLNEGESSISLCDVIEEDQEMEETVDAVLGASDDQACTYPKGYVKRQALYACSTCSTAQDQPAGVCLACSLECHNGHDLYELYTKRQFRCDCGNEKFPDLKCKLLPEKDPLNESNMYSQNFRGLYCTCHRPYPDDEDDVQDEMIQCVVCEDWYHGRHLGETVVPTNMAFSEMVCLGCTNKCSFLLKYGAILVAPTKVEKDFSDIEINVDVLQSGQDGGDQVSENILLPKVDVNTSCKIDTAVPIKLSGATFWPDKWRAVLCKCKSCVKMYDDLEVSYLLDESDTVLAYEEMGKKKALEKKNAQQSAAFSSMSRFLQVEMLTGYKDMKEAFYDHFKKFAEEGKVVTEADVRKFFTHLNNKRQKVDMQYTCR